MSPTLDSGAIEEQYAEYLASFPESIIAMDKSIEQSASDFARKIYEGKLHSKQIHYGLYDATAKKLIDGLSGSFITDFGYDSPANSALDYMQTNVFAFSAAKNMTEFEAFSKLLVKDGVKIPSFSKFKKGIEKLNVRYNERYLKAEYDSAIAQGQMAAKWQEFEENRDAGEYLEYRTAGDERVRASHKALDKKIFHIDDKILERIYPPNDWSCRCTMVQKKDSTGVTPIKEHGALEQQASIPKYFKNNTGKSGMIYDEGHPYFKAFGKKAQLKAVQNFNLPEPNKIYYSPDKLNKLPGKLKSLDAFDKWHTGMIRKIGNEAKNELAISCKSLNGLYLTFDNNLYKRVTKNRKYLKEKRYELIPAMEDVINNPDEIWTNIQKVSHRNRTELVTVLIKYYNDKPMIVLIKSERKKGFGYIRITSFYQLDNLAQVGQWRVGIPRYIKRKS